jgi:F-type H+-transporting ATPase subunit delta
MLSPKLASRYANSLFTLSKERGKLDDVYNDMVLINDSIKGSKELALMLKSPIIPSDKKESIITQIFSGKFSALTTSFIQLIVRKGREKHLAEVAVAFINFFNTERKVAVATLTSAAPLGNDSIEKIKKLLLSIDGNISVQLETKVNPALVGGFVLKYGDKLLDYSIQRKLHLIKKEIQDSSYIPKYS